MTTRQLFIALLISAYARGSRKAAAHLRNRHAAGVRVLMESINPKARVHGLRLQLQTCLHPNDLSSFPTEGFQGLSRLQTVCGIAESSTLVPKTLITP